MLRLLRFIDQAITTIGRLATDIFKLMVLAFALVVMAMIAWAAFSALL